jgi:hypothetical protein
MRQGDQKIVVPNIGGYVEQQIREAQARGEFDNLPGAGKPIDLGGDNPYGAEWDTAYRMAKNAGAAPLWVELDKEITQDTAALQSMLERTASYFAAERARRIPAAAAGNSDNAVAGKAPGRAQRAWSWLFGTRSAQRTRPATAHAWQRAHPAHPTLEQLEAERLRARRLYLKQAAELDAKIQEYNAQRPRGMTWCDKRRLTPEMAGERFDAACASVPQGAGYAP